MKINPNQIKQIYLETTRNGQKIYHEAHKDADGNFVVAFGDDPHKDMVKVLWVEAKWPA